MSIRATSVPISIHLTATPVLWWGSYVACREALKSTTLTSHERSNVMILATEIDGYYSRIGAYDEGLMAPLLGEVK